MSAVHTDLNGAILPAVSRRLAWLKGEMREPLGGLAAFPRDFPLRRGALRVGHLVLAVTGTGMLVGGDPKGVALLLGGGLGVALAHRRVYPTVVGLGVAVAGGWLLVASGNYLGAFLVLGGIALAAVGATREATSSASAVRAVVEPRDHVVGPSPLEPDGAALSAVPALAPSEALTVNSIGRIQLLAGGVDVTKELLGRPVLSFDWLYLLTRAVLSDDRITRLELAAAVAPGVPNQKDRVRDQLRDMQRKLPAAIGQRIVVDRELVRFDASGCDWDVARLRELKRRCEAAGDLVTDDVLAELQHELDGIPAGEFLPGWDHIEREVTEGRGDNDDLVRDARFAVDRLRADLTAILAANLRARGLAVRAIASLEAERSRSPEHPEIFQNLRKAYLETGQHEHAAALTRQYETGDL